MKKNISRWTCNRCKKIEELEYGKQPWGWISVYRSERHVPDGSDRYFQAHLCGICHDEFVEFIGNKR